MKKFTFLFVFAIMANLFICNTVFGQITQVTGSPQSATTTNTTLTITRPSGLAVGDVMIANIVQSDNDDADGGDLSNASLSGWTLIAGNQTGVTGSSGDEWWGTLLYRVATASDVSAANFAFTLDAQADDGSGAIMAFRGVNLTGGVTETGAAGGPFDVDPPNVYQNVVSDQTLNADAITTATANAAVIMFGVLGDNVNLSVWTTTNPGTLSEIYDLPFDAALDMGSGAAWAIKSTIGATGGGTAAISGGNNIYNGALLIALKPLPASATLTPSSQQNVAVGGTVNFTATANNYGGTGNYTYTWTAAGATIPGSNPNSIAASSNSKTLTYPSAGTYTVSVSIARSGETTQVTNTTVVNVYAPPATPNLWAASSSGTIVSSFSVTNSVYFAGPTTVFTPTFPGTTTGGTSTAAIARSDKPSISLGHYYWLPNTSGNAGVVEIFGATSTGGSQTRIGSLDINGGGDGTSLGFVRLGIGPDGTAWILAGSGTQLYLAKIKPNGVMLNGSLPAADQLQVVDDNVSLVGGAAATFQNGDVCILGNGNIYALANNGSGVTQIFIGAPNGSSTTLTKKWDLVNQDNSPFTGQVNGVAFSPTGSLYISTSGTDQGLYYIDAETVNGPAGTVQTSLVIATPNIHDLASNVFPTQSTLPVTLSAFSVYKSGNNAILDWKTSNELNTDHFEIERSYDGINFTVIGNKQAAGNSSSDVIYQYIDPIIISSGNIYYRLKTLDIDGKSSYSKIVVLRINGGIVKDFTVYPNPFTSNLKMEINSEKEVSVVLRLSSASGQVILNRNILLQKGVNVVVLSSELQNLNPGIHILELISDGGKMTQKIIKR